MKTETMETLSQLGTKTMVGGGAVGTYGAFIQSNAIGLGGLVVALLGVLVTTYFRRKADRRMQAEHDLRQAERQLRIDIMRNTGRLVPASQADTDMGGLDD